MYAELDAMVSGKLSPAERSSHPLTKALADQNLKLFWQYLIGEPSKKSGKSSDRPVVNAMLYLQIGKKEQALTLLETALEQPDENLPAVNGDSTFDEIRNEKRFAAIMHKVGLAN